MKKTKERMEMFLEKLEEGDFGIKEFYKINKGLSALNDELENDLERCQLSLIVWKFAFEIQKLLSNYFDENDIYIIDNIELENVHQISTVLDYLTRCIHVSSKINEDGLKFGYWS